eukprot:174469-Pelagomonas_calceolata.AAC.2
MSVWLCSVAAFLLARGAVAAQAGAQGAVSEAEWQRKQALKLKEEKEEEERQRQARAAATAGKGAAARVVRKEKG